MLTTDDINLGGGALMDLGHYPLNALRKYSGMEPAVVSAVSTPPPPDVGDARIDQSLEAELVFPDGSTAGLECSMWAESFSMELRVTYEDGCTGRVRSYLSPGSKGVIWDSDGEVSEELTSDSPLADALGVQSSAGPGEPVLTYDLQLAAFVGEMRGEGLCHTTFDDAILNMELTDGAQPTHALGLRAVSAGGGKGY